MFQVAWCTSTGIIWNKLSTASISGELFIAIWFRELTVVSRAVETGISSREQPSPPFSAPYTMCSTPSICQLSHQGWLSNLPLDSRAPAPARSVQVTMQVIQTRVIVGTRQCEQLLNSCSAFSDYSFFQIRHWSTVLTEIRRNRFQRSFSVYHRISTARQCWRYSSVILCTRHHHTADIETHVFMPVTVYRGVNCSSLSGGGGPTILLVDYESCGINFPFLTSFLRSYLDPIRCNLLLTRSSFSRKPAKYRPVLNSIPIWLQCLRVMLQRSPKWVILPMRCRWVTKASSYSNAGTERSSIPYFYFSPFLQGAVIQQLFPLQALTAYHSILWPVRLNYPGTEAAQGDRRSCRKAAMRGPISRSCQID
jgi:hypothetical protein